MQGTMSKSLVFMIRNISVLHFYFTLLSPSSIIWYRPSGAVMFCGWEGNRRSGVTLAMRHRLSGPSTSKANVWEMSTPPTLHWSIPLYLIYDVDLEIILTLSVEIHFILCYL